MNAQNMLSRLGRLLILCSCFVVIAGCARLQAQDAAPAAAPLPDSMKGYELYSWQPGRRRQTTWHFTLITGTNRLKSEEEIVSGRDVTSDDWVNIRVKGTSALKTLLDRLPKGATVIWFGPEVRTSGTTGARRSRFGLPNAATIDDVVAYAEARGVNLRVAGVDD